MLRRNLTKFLFLLGLAALAVYVATSDAQSTKDKAKADQSGDPLPAGALARMGTVRWRHGDTISFVAFTPDGKAVLTASADNTIRLWDRETGKEIRRFEVKGGAQPNPIGMQPGMVAWGNVGRGPTRVAMSQDGKLLASVLPNNAIQLWDVETGKEVRQLKGPQNGINSIVIAPDGKSLATRGYDRVTRLLEIGTGKEIHQIKAKQPQAGVRVIINGQLNGAEGLAFSPDSKAIATAEMEFGMQKTNTYLKISDTRTGKEIRQVEAPDGVASIAYAPNGKVLAFGSGKTIQLHAADTGKEIRKIDNPNATAGLAFAADSEVLAAKGRDGFIRLFETNTGKSLPELGVAIAAPNANVGFFAFNTAESRDFAFAHDGKVLAAGSGQTLRFWTVATGKEQPLAGGHRGAVSAVVVTPDGKTMLSRGTDNTIRRWDAVTGKELGQFTEPKGTTGVLFAPDGKTAALANSDGTIRLHAVADGKELHSLKGHQNGSAALAFSPDSKTLASRGSFDNAIRLYDVANGGELKQITVSTDKPAGNPGGGFGVGFGGPNGQGLAFSPDGQTLAANLNASGPFVIRGGGAPQPAQNSTLRMWDVTTGKEIRQIILPPQRNVISLAFSPDSRLLATENTDQTLSLWEIASGKERAALGQPAKGGQPASNTTMVVAFNGVSAAPLASTALAFSPDGSLLAVRAPGHAVRVWEVAHAKEIGLLKGHDGAVQAVAFAIDGKRLASASSDTTLLVWDVAGLKREPKATGGALQAKEVEILWADLVSGDAAKAARGILALSAAPTQATPFLREKLKPAAAIDVKKLDQWIAALDSSNFSKRTKASEELEKLGDLAVPALRKFLAAKPSPEARRRVEPLLEKLTTGTLTAEQIRMVRAVEVLEKLGTSEARQVLEALAQGAPGALATRQAQAVLDRLAK